MSDMKTVFVDGGEYVDRKSYIQMRSDLRTAEENLIAANARADAKCSWREDFDGYWETSCGELHDFNEGTPADNSHRFCPYCGSNLIEVRYEEDKPNE